MGPGTRGPVPCDGIHTKGNVVFAAIGDPMGGVTPSTEALLRRWSKDAASGRDATHYGLFEVHGAYFAHHAAAMSMAAVRREAEAVERGTDAREFRRMHSGFYIARPDAA